jgi:hypothetical protein
MSCVKTPHDIRPILLGTFLAALSFSWAVATTPDGAQAESRGVAARQIGTGLRISNPQISTDVFDLGDACFGSAVVRYISGLGGVVPYRFTMTPAATTAPGISLDRSGRVNGTVSLSGPSPATFTATLTDAASETRSGLFVLTTVNCNASVFRFAQNSLPEAQVGQDYITKVATLNETADTVFTVVPGSTQFNGGAITGLEFEGLTLFQDGILAGRPLRNGTLTFTARATKSGQVARDRSNSSNDQTFSITIAPLARIQSVLAVTASTIKGNTTLANGSLNLNAIINTDGQINTDFANERFVLRVGGAVFSTSLDASGQSRNRNFSVKFLAPDGTLRIQLRNANFQTVFTDAALLDRQPTTVVVQLEIGDTYIGTEAVQFDTRNRLGRYNLKYKLGKERQLGGLFQIVSVNGADFNNGTAFKVKFLVSHVKGRTDTEFGVARQARVFIGQGFDQTLTLNRGRGKFSPPGVSSLKIDGKRKTGQLITYALPQSQTGIIPASSNPTTPQDFLMGMDIDTTTGFFSGDSSRVIFPFVR